MLELAKECKNLYVLTHVSTAYVNCTREGLIDEEIYELLKKISKNRDFEDKYRNKATVLLDKVLHFNDYREQLIL